MVQITRIKAQNVSQNQLKIFQIVVYSICYNHHPQQSITLENQKNPLLEQEILKANVSKKPFLSQLVIPDNFVYNLLL